MPSPYMLSHMVTIAIIAVLVKQVVELHSEMVKLQTEVNSLGKIRSLQADQAVGDKHTEHSMINEKPIGSSQIDDQLETDTNADNIDTAADRQVHHIDDDVLNRSDNFFEMKYDENTEGEDCSSENEKHCSVASSVWCYDGINQACHIRNICYNSQVADFVIFIDDSSVFENVVIVDGSVTIDLSTVRNHNARQLTISTLPVQAFTKPAKYWINETVLMFRRFLAENVMHVFHDDLIPLHYTLQMIQHSVVSPATRNRYTPFDVGLFLYEEENDSENDELDKLYTLFSKFKLNYKSDFHNHEDRLICFKNLFVGLMKTTVWYDYGFTKPQGPVSTQAHGHHIRNTALYISHNLGKLVSKATAFLSSDYLVLFTRQENRKILNQVELTLNIVKTTGLKVINLSFETHTFAEVINIIRGSKGVIGMHGSLLILLIFLKPGSFVIELFPYAVQPANYTPYKTLCELPGMNLHYKSWTNQKAEYSVGHPDWLPENGGLNHLEEHERETIISQTEVPSHLCCSDPSWLYHIYQDTIVNSDHVVQLIQEALSEATSATSSQGVNKASDKSPVTDTNKLIVFPSKIKNVSCCMNCKFAESGVFQCELTILWDAPWTVMYISHDSLQYHILVQDQAAPTTDAVISVISHLTNRLDVNVSLPTAQHEARFYVWVRAILNEANYGVFSDAITCDKK